MAKYAPAREDGLKPWVVTVSSWGEKRDQLVYAESNAAAVYRAVKRMQHTYGKGRRATPEDVARFQPVPSPVPEDRA